MSPFRLVGCLSWLHAARRCPDTPWVLARRRETHTSAHNPRICVMNTVVNSEVSQQSLAWCRWWYRIKERRSLFFLALIKPAVYCGRVIMSILSQRGAHMCGVHLLCIIGFDCTTCCCTRDSGRYKMPEWGAKWETRLCEIIITLPSRHCSLEFATPNPPSLHRQCAGIVRRIFYTRVTPHCYTYRYVEATCESVFWSEEEMFVHRRCFRLVVF